MIDFFTTLKNNVRNIMLVLVILLVLCFIVGFFLQGIYGMKFDLGSIWVGVSSLLGVGATGAAYHAINSVFNSPAGEAPTTIPPEGVDPE